MVVLRTSNAEMPGMRLSASSEHTDWQGQFQLEIKPTYISADKVDAILLSHNNTIAFRPLIFPTNGRDK